MSDDNMLDNPELVTPTRVKQELEAIRSRVEQGQYTSATEFEASLHAAVLAAIGRGILAGEGARACAELAASTLAMEFPRIQQSHGW